jgi:hypothetical protein
MRNKIWTIIYFLIVRLCNNTFSNTEGISVEWDEQIVMGVDLEGGDFTSLKILWWRHWGEPCIACALLKRGGNEWSIGRGAEGSGHRLL